MPSPIRMSLLAAAMTALGALQPAWAQSPSPPRPPAPLQPGSPPEQLAPGRLPGETRSEHLNRTDGVIRPPDSGGVIERIEPPGTTAPMPVIPPPQPGPQPPRP